MGRHKYTPEQVAGMRQRILQAAMDIVAEGDPDVITMRAIASRMGVSPMMIYSYYDNRAALMGAVRDEQRRQIYEAREDYVRRAAEEDTEVVMHDLLSSYVSWGRSHPRVFQLIWLIPPDEGAIDDLHSLREDIHHFLAEMVRIGMERGIFAERNPDLASLTAFGICHAPLFLYFGGHYRPDQYLDTLLGEALTVAMAYLRTGVELPAPAVALGERVA